VSGNSRRYHAFNVHGSTHVSDNPRGRSEALVSNLLVALIAAVAITFVRPVQAGVTIENSAVFDNRGAPMTRYWVEHRPDGLNPAERRPLIVVLHPGAATPQNIQSSSGWDAIADEHGLIVVYPGATAGSAPAAGQWNVWDYDGAPPTVLPPNIRERDDASFIDQLITRYTQRAEFPADALRVYMTGFSSGSMMTSSYAGTGRTNVAAYGPVSGGWCEPCGVPSSFFRPVGRTPVWFWRGEREDALGSCSTSRAIHDALQIAFWKAYSQVDPTPMIETRVVTAPNPVPGGPSPVTVTHVTERYSGGRADFWFTEVLDSSHVYQAGAARRLWEEFFSRFCRAGASGAGQITITTQPGGATAIAGQAITLSAAAGPGFDSVAVRWRRNGVDIADGPGGASPGGGTVRGASGTLPSPTTGGLLVLAIDNAQPGDAGSYTAVFTNACGGAITSAATVIVRCPGAGPAACGPADWNEDGVVDFNDLLAFLNDYNASSPCSDVNQDGVTDFNDLLEYLNRYNAGC
jgi:poly(3-hydroxybutyrate) depolymerase